MCVWVLKERKESKKVKMISKWWQKNQYHISQNLQQGQQDMICPDSLITLGHSHCYPGLVWEWLWTACASSHPYRFTLSHRIRLKPKNTLLRSEHNHKTRADYDMCGSQWENIRYHCGWNLAKSQKWHTIRI